MGMNTRTLKLKKAKTLTDIKADFTLQDLPSMQENERGIEVPDNSCSLTISGECFHLQTRPCEECILYQNNLRNYPEEEKEN